MIKGNFNPFPITLHRLLRLWRYMIENPRPIIKRDAAINLSIGNVKGFFLTLEGMGLIDTVDIVFNSGKGGRSSTKGYFIKPEIREFLKESLNTKQE